jgi:hypothetical protein
MPPLTYSAKPITGTVVDAENGQPLEGVIVVAQWVLNLAPSGNVPRLKVLETVTDANGTYAFPGWGPTPNPRYPLTSLNFQAPDLNFYKPEYKPLFLMNQHGSNESVRSSDWDGKPITLQRFRSTDEEWVMSIRRMQHTFAWGGVMEWQSLPRMTIALEMERLRLAGTPIAKRGINVIAISELGTSVEEVHRFLKGWK